MDPVRTRSPEISRGSATNGKTSRLRARPSSPTRRRTLRISRSVPRKERRRHASTDAANSAIAMYFVLAGIHDAQVTLRVDDLSAQRDGTQIDLRCEAACDC